MPEAYEVHPFTADALRRLLAEKATAERHTIDQKQHCTYLERYFDFMGAQTVVVENDYTDRDFLEDFAGYYVRCFQSYPHRCARFHFFSQSFDKAAFTALLSAETPPITYDGLQAAYLGFIVVKPLPRTVIGRTCLRTYPCEGRRFFPITRTYQANLFGLALTVESLAFQEQDTVAAACATSALWSAFQGTGRQFQHHIPSPVEITTAATAHVPLNTRTFPNNAGLTVPQMADAIRSVGLEPYLVNASDEYVLRSTIYSYLRGQIPVLIVIELQDLSVTPPYSLGLHAVTVGGYSLGKSQPQPHPQGGFLLRAFRMDKVYAHDDQVGPFARMELAGGSYFNTSWPNQAGTGQLHARADVLLVPLYHKIRIPYQTIVDMVSPFDSLIETLRQNGNIAIADRLEWDIYLTDVNQLKTELQASISLIGAHRLNILTLPMPRFIWRATALMGDTAVLDLLFDATDIEQGLSFVGAVEYDANLAQVLRPLAQALIGVPQFRTRPDRRILDWFAAPPFPYPISTP